MNEETKTKNISRSISIKVSNPESIEKLEYLIKGGKNMSSYINELIEIHTKYQDNPIFEELNVNFGFNNSKAQKLTIMLAFEEGNSYFPIIKKYEFDAELIFIKICISKRRLALFFKCYENDEEKILYLNLKIREEEGRSELNTTKWYIERQDENTICKIFDNFSDFENFLDSDQNNLIPKEELFDKYEAKKIVENFYYKYYELPSYSKLSKEKQQKEDKKYQEYQKIIDSLQIFDIQDGKSIDVYDLGKIIEYLKYNNIYVK